MSKPVQRRLRRLVGKIAKESVRQRIRGGQLPAGGAISARQWAQAARRGARALETVNMKAHQAAVGVAMRDLTESLVKGGMKKPEVVRMFKERKTAAKVRSIIESAVKSNFASTGHFEKRVINVLAESGVPKGTADVFYRMILAIAGTIMQKASQKALKVAMRHRT